METATKEALGTPWSDNVRLVRTSRLKGALGGR